jgi:hypothetical protein
MKKYIKIFCLCCYLISCFDMAIYSQSAINRFLEPADSLNTSRLNAVIVSESIFYAGGIVAFNKIFDHSYLNHKFHYDHADNLQMDKAAHVFASYQIGNLFFNSLKWSGASKQTQLIYGAGMGFIFLTSLELVEGFSHYGASYSDILANGIGTTLCVSQELLWKEQRVVTKVSFKKLDFISSNPKEMKANVMHEFDDQTVWMSVNLHSFFKKSKIPKWLNVAVGYGVEGVSSTHYITADNLVKKRDRSRQIYLSIDADLTKIETKSHFLKTVFAVFNTIKFPAPTIEYSVKEGFRGHSLYF